MSRAKPWLLTAVLAAGAYSAARGFSPERPHLTLVALDAAEAAALAASAGVPLEDFWERARAVGVGAVVAREERLGDLVRRGEVLAFSKEEVEKWRALGVVAPGASFKTSLWVKEARALRRVLAAAEAAGLSVSTASSGGYTVVESAEGWEPALPAGFDAAAQRARELRLALVSLPEEGLPERVGLRRLPGGATEAGALREGEPALVLETRSLPVAASRAALQRAASSGPRRLIVLRLAPALGLEANMDLLRAHLRELKSRGFRLEPPADLSGAPESAPWRLWLAWLVAVTGPLAAVRLGLQAFKRARAAVHARLPAASPVLEMATGAAGCVAAAAVAGALVHFLAGDAELPGARLALWAPLAIGGLALYYPEGREWRKRWAQAFTAGDALVLALVVLGVAALVETRALLSALGLLDAAARVGDRWAPWWWLWRWREALIGWPALLMALHLLERRLACPDCPGAVADESLGDPRGWLVAGLLAPAGALAAFARPGADWSQASERTFAVLLVGLALGGAAIAVSAALPRGTEGPSEPRSIDPEG